MADVLEVPVRAALPELKLALPGSWVNVDLSSKQAADASVRRIAMQLTHKEDSAANLRLELRSYLGKLADAALEGGATDLFLSVEIVPGLLVPVSLTIFWPTTAILGSLPTRPETVIDLVREALLSEPDSKDYQDALKETVAGTSTWRRTRVLETAPEGEMPGYETLVTDYWIAVPGTQRVVLFTFSTPLTAEKGPMLDLFRAMVGAVRWIDREPAKAGK